MLREGMSIICRTDNEVEAFYQICEKEGSSWCGKESIRELSNIWSSLPVSFQIGFDERDPRAVTFTTDLTYAEREKNFRTYEASELFYNQIIQINLKKSLTNDQA